MRKLPSCPTTCLLGLATLVLLTGCAGKQRVDDYQRTMLERLPFVYKMNVQQGNVITAEQVAQLQPGMNKRQVRFLLGTPLLTDFFNSDRWDYVYTMQRPRKPKERYWLTVFFQDDALLRVEGDARQSAPPTAPNQAKETVVTVPDYQERGGVITRGLKAVGITKGK
ncbi:outer membrane protein assembly factor BamE [uncultured Thiodictyon sp.]|uniref:outer membrane protein assembly factor BamE n=1 Tax=uncultured Thiodictyon sp. TaxID=1846217 RepID=UPI0025F1A216|nr:outer membrane protein assembly factor BamE [uncultured Thiodictyon sp.]